MTSVFIPVRSRVLRSFHVALMLVVLGGADTSAAHDGTPAPEASLLSDPGAFSPTIHHPLFPVSQVQYKEFRGKERDPDTGESTEISFNETVLPETRHVASIAVTVVEVREYEDGALVELTHDFYAQHRDGTVYYLGEDVNDVENGTVVGHSGAWLAGEGENLPGVFMPPDPQLGDTFNQERAPGIAEDRSTIVAVDQSVRTLAGTFTGCLRTEDVNPLDGSIEFKTYCPGVGLVREENENKKFDLVTYQQTDEATPET
jgi:hypothetical protein